ncbi:hypothetical protein NPIL_294671 [Nephila pilipes]|uniref:Uncharacterized protein n=1 Tax=Nephila pilipes TaxID=299642 RepID=A0A8X6P512_NEPPI|nr:hypothetical protein NPIL_294671 [Nephila pilipes]
MVLPSTYVCWIEDKSSKCREGKGLLDIGGNLNCMNKRRFLSLRRVQDSYVQTIYFRVIGVFSLQELS